MNIENYSIDENASIFEAMEKININAKGIIYVLHQDELVGVVTDGDIRRYILEKGDLNNSRNYDTEIWKRSFGVLFTDSCSVVCIIAVSECICR